MIDDTCTAPVPGTWYSIILLFLASLFHENSSSAIGTHLFDLVLTVDGSATVPVPGTVVPVPYRYLYCTCTVLVLVLVLVPVQHSTAVTTMPETDVTSIATPTTNPRRLTAVVAMTPVV